MIGLLGSLLGSAGGGMLGRMMGGRTGGMVGSLAGAMLGGRHLRRLGRTASRRGDSHDPDDHGRSRQAAPPPPEAAADSISDEEAEILIRAMCNSAKSDGHVDENEAQAILSELGEIANDERDFLMSELRSPLRSAADIARSVPHELANEAYAVSLVAINVDTIEEADYLRDLAAEMGLSTSQRNEIHAELGVASL